MLVRNVKGTSRFNCKCGSWLDHYNRFGGLKSNYCVVEDCLNLAAVGAHIVKLIAFDQDTYIIPMCKQHNASDKLLSVDDDYVTVKASRENTCGY